MNVFTQKELKKQTNISDVPETLMVIMLHANDHIQESDKVDLRCARVQTHQVLQCWLGCLNSITVCLAAMSKQEVTTGNGKFGLRND